MQTELEVIAEAAENYRLGALYSLENVNGNRSKNRTDILHQGVVDALRKTLGLSTATWRVDQEIKVSCARAGFNSPEKTFSIDIIFTNVFSGRKIYILFKSIEKSHNKNKENFSNCKFGETQRLFGYSEIHDDKLRNQRKDDILIFVTYLPEYCLNGDSIEKVKEAKIEERNFKLIHDKVFDLTFNIGASDFAPHFDSFVRSGIGQVTNVAEVKTKLALIRNELRGSQ